jgi:hypothetical protein
MFRLHARPDNPRISASKRSLHPNQNTENYPSNPPKRTPGRAFAPSVVIEGHSRGIPHRYIEPFSQATRRRLNLAMTAVQRVAQSAYGLFIQAVPGFLFQIGGISVAHFRPPDPSPSVPGRAAPFAPGLLAYPRMPCQEAGLDGLRRCEDGRLKAGHDGRFGAPEGVDADLRRHDEVGPSAPPRLRGETCCQSQPHQPRPLPPPPRPLKKSLIPEQPDRAPCMQEHHRLSPPDLPLPD